MRGSRGEAEIPALGVCVQILQAGSVRKTCLSPRNSSPFYRRLRFTSIIWAKASMRSGIGKPCSIGVACPTLPSPWQVGSGKGGLSGQISPSPFQRPCVGSDSTESPAP